MSSFYFCGNPSPFWEVTTHICLSRVVVIRSKKVDIYALLLMYLSHLDNFSESISNAKQLLQYGAPPHVARIPHQWEQTTVSTAMAF